MKALGSAVAETAPTAPPGLVVDDPLVIACGDGAVRLTTVQRAGKGPMAATDFLRGFHLRKGDRAA